jgi:SAM-dependent methyltransferase
VEPSPNRATASSYSRVAAEYAEQFKNELDHKPFDRDLLDQFAARLNGQGPVCDLGCGPGHIAAYLYARGVTVFGLDLACGMAHTARQLFPHIAYAAADMRRFPAVTGSLAGIAAFYTLIHIPRDEQVATLRELQRVLRPGGLLLMSYHVGDETVHIDDWWDHAVSLDFISFQREEVTGYLEAAGFVIESNQVRDPYDPYVGGAEYPSVRGYILARKPA